jgi:hypothetical protein
MVLLMIYLAVDILDTASSKNRTVNTRCIDRAHLIAIDHEVLCGDEGLEDHHPAGVGGPLKQ